MNRAKQLRNNFIWVQLYYFFRSFIFAYVIERLFWRSRGISIPDTVIIEIIYAITLVVMEVPTGVWADRWSRKRMIVLGAGMTLIGSGLMLFANGFLAFALIIMMSGVSGALTSGSVSALLYDSLKEVGESFAFEKYLARVKGIRYTSGLLAALLGAYLASEYNLLLPYQLSVISCFVMFVMTLLLTEPNRLSEESDTTLSAKEILCVSRKVILNSRFLKYIFIVGGTIGASITYIEEFWQNYCDGIHISVVYFGIISGMMSLVVILGAFHTHKISFSLKANFKIKNRYYTLMMVLTGMCFIALYYVKHPLGIVFILMMIYVEALVDTIVLGDIHHQVASEYRATAESIYSMFSNVMSMVIGLVFAYVSQSKDVFDGFFAIGAIVIVVMIIEKSVVHFKKPELL